MLRSGSSGGSGGGDEDKRNDPGKSNLFSSMMGKEKEKKRNRDEAKQWSNTIPSEMKYEPDKRPSSDFFDTYGGSSDFINLLTLKKLDTSPSSPEPHVNDFRRLADDEEIEGNIVLNLNDTGDLSTGSNYNQYHLYATNKDFDLDAKPGMMPVHRHLYLAKQRKKPNPEH